MSPRAQEVLEFDQLRELLRSRTTCALGRRNAGELEPSADRHLLTATFAHIREAREWLRAGRELGFGALADPQAWLAKIEGPGAVLAAGELLDAASLLETSGWLRQQFREEAAKFPLLAVRAASLADFRDLLAAIRQAVLPNQEISDHASAALGRIRASMAQTRNSIQKKLKQILRARTTEAAENYVTLRNERFVIPLRAEHRPSVPGVVHGASATGQTVFVEPLEVLESNNQLVELAENQAAEILRILRELTEQLELRRAALLAATRTIAELDSLFARARFAHDFDACIPEFRDSPEVALEAVRHPVLEDKLRREDRTVVPMTLVMGGRERVLVISGPNTGGKTVTLKTVGLAALAGQAGIPVAAERAVLPLFDRVLVDIGDEQSIARDLSTFSAHVLNLKSMLAEATPQSLVLADEVGTGTAPEEGAALAIALLDALRAKGSIVLATTHHDRLKTYASTTPGVVNAAVEFDDVNLRPTYRFTVGVPGGSSGIAIADRLGLGSSIIERAYSLLAPESRQAADLIAYLHRSRDELDHMQQQMTRERHALEVERETLRSEWIERQQKRIGELEGQFAQMHKRCEESVARVVDAVKEGQLRGQLEKSARRKMHHIRSTAREELNAAVVQTISESQAELHVSSVAAETISPERLESGARVRVRGFSKPVIFRRLDGSLAEIEAGPLRMKVAADEIVGIAGPLEAASTASARRSSGVTVHAQPGLGAAADEINVIGSTVEEATERVDKFLDEAALAHKPRVRIVHGYGTGALRKGLAQFLSSHPLVERVSLESEERGGKAITVVELRG